MDQYAGIEKAAKPSATAGGIAIGAGGSGAVWGGGSGHTLTVTNTGSPSTYYAGTSVSSAAGN